MDVVELYTDGSAKETCSGFAVVVVVQDFSVERRTALLGFLAGQVEVETDSPNYIGADKADSQQAEISAMAWATLWALAHRSQYPDACIAFRFDNMLAGFAAAGKWSDQCCHVAGKCRQMMQFCEHVWGINGFRWVHTPAHSDHPWNEMADSVAGAAMQGQRTVMNLPCLGLGMPPGHINFDLAGFGSGGWRPCLPRYSDGWINWGQDEGRLTAISPEQLIPARRGRDVKLLRWTIKAITANIQSGADKLHFLEKQLVAQGVNVVFMQEMKGKEGLIKSNGFLRYETESQGAWGCAVWLSKSVPLASDGEEDLLVCEQDVTVVICEPRLLLLRIQTPASAFYMASLHRPAQSRPCEERASFERALGNMLELTSGQPCIIGIDANGRVPAEEGFITGELRCGDPDQAGVDLVCLLRATQMWIPSTFACCHHGPSETWTHPSGKRSRIDFFLLSCHFGATATSTWAALELDLLNRNDDHDAVGLQTSMVQECQGARPSQLNRTRGYDPRKLRQPEALDMVDYWIEVFNLKSIPWELDVNLHAQIVQDALYAILCSVAPVDARGPASSYVPDAAWRIRESRQTLKKLTRWRKAEYGVAVLREPFALWRGTACSPDDTTLRVSKPVLLYEMIAAAVKVSTDRIRRLIRDCKNEKLGDIAKQVGKISPASIFRRLKELRLGARQPKTWKNSLPRLRGQDGQLVNGRIELDRAWLTYFGEMEMGELANTTDYIARTTSAAFQDVYFEPQLALIPTLSDIERLCRSTKTDKAAGLDRIPGELLKGCASRMATTLQPLFTKAVLRGRQPVQWRGGMLIEALKKAGMGASLSGHRSLFVGSVVGKTYHRFIRTKIIDKTENTLRDTHFGARRGATVTQASHIAVLYESAQAKRKCSSALLFMDAKSAYYCVIRQLVYGSRPGTEDNVVHKIMRHFQLPSTVWEELLETISSGGLFAQCGLSDHVAQLTKDLHDASFFVTRHAAGDVVMETQLGSRPGESIADIIFAWILHRVLDRIEVALADRGCCDFIEAGDARDLWEAAEGGRTPILGPIWADDGAFMASHRDPEELWRRAQGLAHGVVQTFFESGLTPNLEKGKSELMLTLRGPKSRDLQKRIFADGCRTMELSLGHWGIKQLRLVTEYIHLGCVLDRGASLKFEALRRIARAQGAFQEHRRRLYQNPSIPLPTRGVLFTAMVESTMFNLEVWADHHGAAWEKLRAGHLKLLKRLVARDLPNDKLLSARASDLVVATEHPPLEILLRGKRLRYLLTLVRGAPNVLWALLHLEQTWQSSCRSDVMWLIDHADGQWPTFGEAYWPEWWCLLRDHPNVVRRAVATATRAATATFALTGTFKRLGDALLRDAYRMYPGAFSLEGGGVWLCGPCRKTFRRKAHLACHLCKAHRRPAECRFFTTGAICTACGKDFQSEARLQRHLGYSKCCWEAVRASGRTASVVAPGIGSWEWKQQQRDRPILHPPVLADVFVVGGHTDAGHGETPGDEFIRKCTWAIGGWIAGVPEGINFETFVCELVQLVLPFPLYPEEISQALKVTCDDIDTCLEEDLLDWSIATAVRIKAWLLHCREAICGRWLCEWADIPLDCDLGPGVLHAGGAASILVSRQSVMATITKSYCVGDFSDAVERTLRLECKHALIRQSWNDLADLIGEPETSCVFAGLKIPGEAVAGGHKSTSALDGKEVRGAFSLARFLMHSEPLFREVWKLFLRGARVRLFVSGSRACGAVGRNLNVLQLFSWQVQLLSEDCICLSSDGLALSSLSGSHLSN